MNARPLHHATRERAVQRRQTESAIAEDFNQLTARAEEQHRTKLWINAAAENQFVALARNHRLHDHADKIYGVALRADCFRDLSICRPNCRFAPEIELHAADIRFVRDGVRVNFQHHGTVELRGFLHCLSLACRDDGRHNRDSIRSEKLFRFWFRQQRAPGLLNAFDDMDRFRASGGTFRLLRHECRSDRETHSRAWCGARMSADECGMWKVLAEQGSRLGFSYQETTAS